MVTPLELELALLSFISIFAAIIIFVLARGEIMNRLKLKFLYRRGYRITGLLCEYGMIRNYVKNMTKTMIEIRGRAYHHNGMPEYRYGDGGNLWAEGMVQPINMTVLKKGVSLHNIDSD